MLSRPRIVFPCCLMAIAVLWAGCSGEDPAPQPSGDSGLAGDAGVQFEDQGSGTRSVCGDAVVEGDEECDDGDLTSGDGCSAACQLEALSCGQGGECLFELGEWGDYGACSHTCGVGTHTRTRPCVREDGQQVACESCGGGECEQNEACEDYSGCTYAYGAWVTKTPCLDGGVGQKILTRPCLRSDGAEVSCTFCGGDCEQIEACCSTGFNIGGGTEQWCNEQLQLRRDECLSAGCALNAPSACVYGSYVSCSNCWHAQGTCVCADGEGPWC